MSNDMTQIVVDRKVGTIEQRAKLFRGFADPSRLSILGALCGEPLVVHELVERVGLEAVLLDDTFPRRCVLWHLPRSAQVSSQGSTGC